MKKSGVRIIAEERQEQIKEKGYTLKYDRFHNDNGELLKAAICYTSQAQGIGLALWLDRVPFSWPYSAVSWKPAPLVPGNQCPVIKTEDAIKMLAKAGAFIAAEIDRLNSLKP